MQQPPPGTASPSPSALNREAAGMPSPAAAPSAVTTETVVRPDGLRRGYWEAKPWTFYGMATAMLILGLLYGLFRLRILRSRSRRV